MQVANLYFRDKITELEILENFAGLRPIVKSNSKNISKASREAIIERIDELVDMFGERWIPARALGQSIARTVELIR
jgi:glycerol-3-phosphate dehydrogenase